ncbi:MAG: deoxyribonuclease IV [Bacillales bacterium]|nr:deoxyribonuclease IV [Bacillales bacterium]
MLKIGCHVSSSNGYTSMIEDTKYIGGNVFQWFTRNPRGCQAKEINPIDFSNFLSLAKEYNFGPFLAHAPYTLNPCSSKEEVREFALDVFKKDMEILEKIPNSMYNFHPGSHVGQGKEIGIQMIIELLNNVIKEEQSTIILLETMAGKGSEVGSRFEELKMIIDGVKYNNHLGVCLDTCHVFDGEYDIVNHLDEVLDEFDRIIGLNRLKAIHLNDTKNPFGSHKDRHECIGKGYLGIDAISRIINHPKLKHLPFYLETPNELDGYKDEITLLKSKYIG